MTKSQISIGETKISSAVDVLDEIEPDPRHLDGLIAAFRILGEADAIEPVAVSSLARCAHETLEEIERNWRTAIDTLREH